MKVNFENTKNLIEAITAKGMIPDRFIYTSSLAAFGSARTIQQNQSH